MHASRHQQNCPEGWPSKTSEMASLNKPYRRLVSKLMYLSVFSRPDNCFALYNLAELVSIPGMVYWVALMILLCYLKGSTNLSLVFHKGATFELLGYSDSEWTTDEADRKSTSGLCFKVNCHSSVCLVLLRNKLVLHLVLVRPSMLL